MEKKGPYFIVGLFVMLGMAGLIGFGLWLGGSIDTRKYDSYTILFTDPVGGLKKGAAVQYRGVDVGKVTDVRISNGRRNVILVDIRIQDSVPIAESTVGQLEIFGITGLVFIGLSTDAADSAPPRRIEGEPYPVITGKGTQLAKLLSDIPDMAQKIVSMTDRINSLLSEDNITRVEGTLANLEVLTRDFNGLLSEHNVAAASEALKQASLTMQEVSGLGQSAQSLIERLEKTAVTMESAANNLNTMLADTAPHIRRFSEQGLKDIEATSKAARKMAESLRDAADQIGSDPSQILYPAPGGTTSIPHK